MTVWFQTDRFLRKGVAALVLVSTMPGGEPREAPTTENDLPRLIAALGHEHCSERDAAQRRLLHMAERNLSAVLQEAFPAYRKAKDPEVRIRLRNLFRAIFRIHVVDRPRGYLGIHMGVAQAADTSGRPCPAIQVLRVLENTAADAGGLRVGDLILRIDQLDMREDRLLETFAEYVQSLSPGQTVRLTVRRGEATHHMDITLGSLPSAIRDAILARSGSIQEQFHQWLQTHYEEYRRRPTTPGSPQQASDEITPTTNNPLRSAVFGDTHSPPSSPD